MATTLMECWYYNIVINLNTFEMIIDFALCQMLPRQDFLYIMFIYYFHLTVVFICHYREVVVIRKCAMEQMCCLLKKNASWELIL